MKYLFFVILSINAVVFIWEINQQPSDLNNSVESHQTDGLLIKLVSELDAQDPLLKSTSLKKQRCYYIGPFEKQAKAQNWLEHYQNQVEVKAIDSKLVKSKKEYQLYIQAADSQQLAEQYADKLRSQGIVDFSIAANWEILLAWYNDPAEAEAAQMDLRKLGWNSQTRSRELLTRQYFVNLSVIDQVNGDFLQKRNWPTEFQQADIQLLTSCEEKQAEANL